MSVVLQTGVMHYRENEQDQWHPLIIKAQSIDLEALVDPYEPTVPKTWMQGEYCLQDDKIWRCVNPVTTPADFDEDDWVQTTFGYEIEQIGAGLASEATTRASEDTSIRNTLNHLEDGLAIIVNGDTCSTAIPVGGYAYIRNNTHGLAEGLYTNTSASAFPTSGGTANSSVFTFVSDGGLNSLKNSLQAVTDLKSQLTWHEVEPADYATYIWKMGRIVFLNAIFITPSTVTSDLTIADLPFYVLSPFSAPIYRTWTGAAAGLARVFQNRLYLASNEWTPSVRVNLSLVFYV